MHQFQARLERRLNVPPQVDHRVKLKHASAVDGLQIVVIQKVINHVLAKTGTDKAGQANDQMVREVTFHKFLKQAAMQAVGVQAFLVNRGVFIHTNRAFEDIDGADQNEGFAGHRLQVRHQAFNVSAVGAGVAVGNPFLSWGSGAENCIAEMAIDILDVC